MALAEDPDVHRFTVDEFAVLAEGIAERVELIDGVIYDVGEETIDHARIVIAVVKALLHLRSDLEVTAGGTVRLKPRGAPIPDVAMYKANADTSSRYFQAADLLLAVEVSLSTGARDRLKLLDYARAGVPEVWIIDRPASYDGDLRLIRHNQPDVAVPTYGITHTFRAASVEELDLDLVLNGP